MCRDAHLAPRHLRAGIQGLEQRNARYSTGPALSTKKAYHAGVTGFCRNRISVGVPNGTHQTTERPLSFTIDLLVVAA